MAPHTKPIPEQKKYKDTLNLPQTNFPIRPNAAIDDPAMINRWQEEGLYKETYQANQGNEAFILHDGPPYANGHIHLGTAYNKILKDIVCKSYRMAGKHVPFTPGWDCHGLPIELNVTKEHPGLSPSALKKECRAYAKKWIDIQREEFKRLGVLADWDNPYLTMNYTYEGKILEAFAQFVAQGFIQKKAKTVPWCASCKTVLAAAEIEYYDRKDPSIYVLFSLLPGTIKKLFPTLIDKPVHFLIWTTTPWTLPLNRAVVLKPATNYQVLNIDGQYIIVGAARADAISELLGVAKKVVAEVNAEAFEGIFVTHPFVDELTVPLILDASVSLQEGTACVHSAPGCGPEDYEIAVKHNLEIFSPLTVDGKYAKGIEPHELEGISVADGQGWVLKTLQEKNALLLKKSITHSYPHCWRCRNGLIFRATRQWFLDLAHNDLKEKALKAIDSINFLPKKSLNYLRATIQGRLEWCISRQRVWGVPIPALLCSTCEYVYSTFQLVQQVATQVATHGIEYWDDVTIVQLGLSHIQCPQCFTSDFKKETDILDVWFDSGVSHFAVLYDNPALGFPADMYLEGIDQHRGWFQSSLLTSLVLEKQASTRTILTHGFTVDQKGHKMSKSLGNVVTPAEIIEKLGTDGLRLWVSSIDFGGDAIVSDVLMNNVAEVYRKIRNTARFLLSNLYDFNREFDEVALEDMLLVDRFALERLFHANLRIRAAYEQYDFSAIFHELADYCAKDLSSFYLDIIKDRLYVEKADGRLRRSAQTACWYILDTLTRVIAPILSCTAEQISDLYQRNKLQSIHLQPFAELTHVWEMIIVAAKRQNEIIDWYPFKARASEAVLRINMLDFHAQREFQWELFDRIRSNVLKAIERQRESGVIKHSLEAKVIIHFALSEKEMSALHEFFADIKDSPQTIERFLKEFFVVSQCVQTSHKEGLAESELKGLWIKVDHADGTKCPRCWQWEVTDHPDHLCKRCSMIIK